MVDPCFLGGYPLNRNCCIGAPAVYLMVRGNAQFFQLTCEISRVEHVNDHYLRVIWITGPQTTLYPSLIFTLISVREFDEVELISSIPEKLLIASSIG